MADGTGYEVARAYITIVPSLEGSQKTIAEELGASAGEAAKDVGEKSGKDFGEALAKGIKATASIIAGAMTAVATTAIATGKAFIDTANEVSSMGDTIGDTAAKMGISTQAYQEWDFVMQRCGTSIESMKSAMKTLANAAVSNNEAFAELGITQEEIATLNQEDLFARTIEALQQVDDETTRTALASKLLGKGAMELGGVFELSAEETEELKQKMYDLGVYMDEDMIASSDAYQDTLLDMQDSIKGLKMSVVKDFLPGMTSVMNGLSKVFSGNGGIEEIKEGLNEVITNIAQLSPEFVTLASAIIMSLLGAFGPLLPELLTGIFSFLNEALLGLVALIPSLLPVITLAITELLQTVFSCLPLITSSLITLITDLVTWLASGSNAKTMMDGIVKLVTEVVSQIAMVLPVLLPAVVTIISEVAQCLTEPANVEMLIQALLLTAGALFMALVNVVPVLIDYVIGVLGNLTGLLSDFFAWTSPLVAQGITAIVNTVKTWGNNAKSFITNLISNIKTAFVNWINNLKSSFATGFSNIQNTISNIVGKIQNFVSNVIQKIKELPGKALSIGQDIVKGLWEGISDKVDWVVEKVKKMGSKITNAIKEVLGIASPSKVFAEIGDFMAQGLGLGFEDGMQDVNSDMTTTMEGLTGSMTAEVNAYGTSGAATIGESNTYNGGAVTINVYGAEGQDVNNLAEVVAEKLENMTSRRGAVYA